MSKKWRIDWTFVRFSLQSNQSEREKEKNCLHQSSLGNSLTSINGESHSSISLTDRSLNSSLWKYLSNCRESHLNSPTIISKPEKQHHKYEKSLLMLLLFHNRFKDEKEILYLRNNYCWLHRLKIWEQYLSFNW